MANKVYSINGTRGKHIDVYEDKLVITTKSGIGSFLTGNFAYAENTIYYRDAIDIKFEKADLQLGYLQIETASSSMNNLSNNFFNENSFTFALDTVSNDTMEEVTNYVKQRVDEIKSGDGTTTAELSPADELKKLANTVYSINGAFGKHLDVYEDKVVITTKSGVGSFLAGNFSDGEKTIYYRDAIGIQFKKSALQIGYLQIETASSSMNNLSNNFFNENSFTFALDTVSNDTMEEVTNYIKQRVDEIKSGTSTKTAELSQADELKKFKELLDMGVISQEEFDWKKKQILGM